MITMIMMTMVRSTMLLPIVGDFDEDIDEDMLIMIVIMMMMKMIRTK